MKKFETPEMKISQFYAENVITASGEDITGTKAYAKAKQELQDNHSVAVDRILTLTF